MVQDIPFFENDDEDSFEDNLNPKKIASRSRSNSKSIKVDNQTNGAVYNPDELDEIDSFTAKPYEAWILNVKKPHSVTSPSNGIRSAYCIQTSHFSYNDLKKMIKRFKKL